MHSAKSESDTARSSSLPPVVALPSSSLRLYYCYYIQFPSERMRKQTVCVCMNGSSCVPNRNKKASAGEIISGGKKKKRALGPANQNCRYKSSRFHFHFFPLPFYIRNACGTIAPDYYHDGLIASGCWLGIVK